MIHTHTLIVRGAMSQKVGGRVGIEMFMVHIAPNINRGKVFIKGMLGIIDWYLFRLLVLLAVLNIRQE